MEKNTAEWSSEAEHLVHMGLRFQEIVFREGTVRASLMSKDLKGVLRHKAV